jgi:hypothetical protein
MPALKQARLTVAQGSGTQACYRAHDLCDDFVAVSGILADGR